MRKLMAEDSRKDEHGKMACSALDYTNPTSQSEKMEEKNIRRKNRKKKKEKKKPVSQALQIKFLKPL